MVPFTTKPRRSKKLRGTVSEKESSKFVQEVPVVGVLDVLFCWSHFIDMELIRKQEEAFYSHSPRMNHCVCPRFRTSRRSPTRQPPHHVSISKRRLFKVPISSYCTVFRLLWVGYESKMNPSSRKNQEIGYSIVLVLGVEPRHRVW